MSAFSPWQPCSTLEQSPLPSCSKAGASPTLCLTRGLNLLGKELPGAVAAQARRACRQAAGRLTGRWSRRRDRHGACTPCAGAAAQQSLTLPDGRLNVGTQLGTLAGRYRYLSRVAEGVSSQVWGAQGEGYSACLKNGCSHALGDWSVEAPRPA